MATTMLNFAVKCLVANLRKVRPIQLLRAPQFSKDFRPILSSVLISNTQTRSYGSRKLTVTKNSEYYLSDSDDEREVFKLKGNSNFWRWKMQMFHKILDLNNDGVLSFDDFSLLADRFINLGHISDKRAEGFRNLVKKIWETQWGEVTKYNLVTVEQYIEDMTHVINDPERSKNVDVFLPYLFEAVDTDRSGKITLAEFKLFFECLGHSDEDALFTFRVIDMDADGRVSKQEFVKYGRDYFLTEDKARISKYFWGPIEE